MAWRISASPTPWPRDDEGAQTDAALQEVLAPYGLACWPETLASAQARLCRAIDAAAETQRQRWITPGAGQAMTYLTKADEARRAVSAGAAADTADYPLLAAEIGITAASLLEVAGAVLAAHQAWLVAGAAIEAARLACKAAVGTAADIAGAEAAAAAVVWPA
ncbi:MAG: hypothetical protein B7Z15_02625 [Rhizobiales bacterium 32-66-8]|nr:MAG: hypothetical protein B7Z15_02625 [Rhizobiales bacterium 32-66-8]